MTENYFFLCFYFEAEALAFFGINRLSVAYNVLGKDQLIARACFTLSHSSDLICTKITRQTSHSGLIPGQLEQVTAPAAARK